MSGLYSTMNVAVRGMTAQQGAIDVTTHNIANANTEGYSRQRALMETTTPFGMPSMNNAVGPGQLGTGVQISSISRIRDSYLDYRVRAENGTKGLYDGREKFLLEVQSVFNEPSDTGVSTLLGKVYDSWQALKSSPELSNTRTVVAQQSKALTDELNSNYNQLISLKGDCQKVIKQDVVDVNSMLNQIDNLNQQIKSVKIGGNEPNDLMDKRDLLEDQLSTKFGITIDKQTYGGEDIKATDIANSSLVKSTSNENVNRFSYVSSIVPTGVTKTGETGTYDVTYYKNGDMSTDTNKVTMSMGLTKDQYASLDQCRVLLADKDGNAVKTDGTTKIPDGAVYSDLKLFTPTTGELKGYMSVQADVDKYVNQLNSLAKGIAFSVNAVLSGEEDATTSTTTPNFFVNKDDATITGETGITAGNISVNKSILDDVMSFNVGKDADAGPTDGSKAVAIAQLRNVKLDIQGIDVNTTRKTFLNGKFAENATLGVKTITSSANGMTTNSYFTDVVNTLAIQAQEATRISTNQDTQLSNLEESRNSVSGVSLDEEMSNLIQFQHAYQANAKIISTVDELLDLIINGLKK
ncbi:MULTISPECIES: flagellar hook-associated protein FlgK [Clostridium]|uniref:Flagellar hook-associated protein 1 n=1 Tax=Clostridium frigoriphilum TaxID=443253 RepID=A0ABU7UI86_9CLOT|nr:flagellar hook-associated protein FlgK [Clostridium sp. DSM 17811]MBU3098601.1 flagellar hook-associated protein FlgK [Clostridium sp. DSM 17811]